MFFNKYVHELVTIDTDRTKFCTRIHVFLDSEQLVDYCDYCNGTSGCIKLGRIS